MKEHMLKKCKIIDFPKIKDVRGNLTFIEQNGHVPFELKRVYYIYDVPSGETRGGHAHKELEQVIISLSGSFDVVLDDGYDRETFTLNRPHYGLYIYPGVWREMENFSSNSVGLVLASTLFDESDYIRDYDEFVEYIQKKEE